MKNYDKFLSQNPTKHSAPLFNKNKQENQASEEEASGSTISDANPATNNFNAFE